MNKKALVLLIIIMGCAIVGGIIYNAFTNPNKLNNSSQSAPGELSVQINLEDDTYSIGDTITFKSIIKNTGSGSKSYTFNSTCTEGTLHIDQQPTQRGKVCGQAITKVEPQPSETISHTYTFTLVDEFSHDVDDDFIEYAGELKLSPGTHTATLNWQGVESNELPFTVQ